MKGKRYVSIDLPDDEHHFAQVDWAPKPKKSLNEAEAKRISRTEAASLLFMVRQ